MKRAPSPKPVCQACNRPFDPRSPGATPWMGPTCAKRVGAALDVLNLNQLGFALDFEDAPLPTRVPPPRPAPRQMPRRFDERYVEAKLAFDELYREFCRVNAPLVGPAAEILDSDLKVRGAAAYTLRDPSLAWLEPEHDLTLLIDGAGGRIYHRRALNGVVTLLVIDPARSASARRHVELITTFVNDLRAHCDEVAETQPPLQGL